MAEPKTDLYPLQFEPVLKDYPWGGSRIARLLGRKTQPGRVAESWELADHPDGRTPVANGRLAGLGLDSLLARYAERLVGTRNQAALGRGSFPLLVKILDAREWLSVQVHPDDEHAVAYEADLGKTEMWIVLDAEPDAEILLGFRSGVDELSFREAIRNGTVTECLHRIAARAGDVFFVPPGTVHAIGPGLLLVEVQQSSNVTYRVFDWNRAPARPLHIEESLAVLDFDRVEPGPVTPRPLAEAGHQMLAECRYFRTERVDLEPGDETAGHLAGDTFEIWGTLDGIVEIESRGERVSLPAISWSLLPAALGDFRIRAETPAKLLRILTPDVS